LKQLNSTDKGVTLVELLVTIVIIAIFTPMLFDAFSGLFITSYDISRRTEATLSAITTKRIMDHHWSEIDSVVSLTPSRIAYVSIDGTHEEISVANGLLTKGSNQIADSIISGEFSYEKVDCSDKRLLIWEMYVRGIWVSGVRGE